MSEKEFYMNKNELTGVMPPDLAFLKDIQKDWLALCKAVHHAFAYGLECNDMTHGEVISDISFAMDEFAKKNGLPEHPWDDDYESLYAEEEETSQD